MRKINVEIISPKQENMDSKWIKCWKCCRWVKSKPYFDKGIKKFKYYDKDGEHGCRI